MWYALLINVPSWQPARGNLFFFFFITFQWFLVNQRSNRIEQMLSLLYSVHKKAYTQSKYMQSSRYINLFKCMSFQVCCNLQRLISYFVTIYSQTDDQSLCLRPESVTESECPKTPIVFECTLSAVTGCQLENGWWQDTAAMSGNYIVLWKLH